jgi:signal transduction histidine kinase
VTPVTPKRDSSHAAIFDGCAIMEIMKKTVIERGLLSIFQIFTGLEFAFWALSAIDFTRQVTPKHPIQAIALTLPTSALLLAYLFWPRLDRRLGTAYLPLALGLNLVSIFLGKWAVGTFSPIQYHDFSQQMVLFLFFPMLIVSWQYDFRAVLVLLLVVGLTDLALSFLALGAAGMTAVHYGQTIFYNMVAFLIVGYIISQVMMEQRTQRQALSHYATTLEQLTVSQERNRMARELHDTLAHTLSGMAVQLEAVQTLWDSSPEEARAMLGKAITATRSGLTETRRALQSLRASPLDDLGLALALRDQAEVAASRAGFHLEWNLPETLPKLPPDAEQGIYRVAQEAFQNIARHAAARQVRVDWSQQNGNATLTIADDGRGFSISGVEGEGHFGLRGMQERANMLGADLELVSQPGQGTTIKLTLKV